MIYDLKAIRSIQIINNSIILIGICVNSNSDNELIKYVHISSELENGWDKKTIKVQANAGKSTLECIYLNRMCNIEISLF